MADKSKPVQNADVRTTAENTRMHARLAMGLNPKVQSSVSRPATKP